MTALQVRDCPPEVYEQLRQCATEENRSISQQVLTIIEDYLSRRSAAKQSAAETSDAGAIAPPIFHRSKYSIKHDDIDYRERRKKVFEKIREFPPIPIDEERPRSDVLLAQIREEEAR